MIWLPSLIPGVASAYASSLAARRAAAGMAAITDGMRQMDAVAPGAASYDLYQRMLNAYSSLGVTYQPGTGGATGGICAYCDTPRPNYMTRCRSCGAMQVKERK